MDLSILFLVHQDAEKPQTETPHKVPDFSCNALSERKKCDFGDMNYPRTIFEPEDPTKRVMYPKHLVYAGVEEFSLEELRATKYLQRYKKQQEEEEMKKQQGNKWIQRLP